MGRAREACVEVEAAKSLIKDGAVDNSVDWIEWVVGFSTQRMKRNRDLLSIMGQCACTQAVAFACGKQRRHTFARGRGSLRRPLITSLIRYFCPWVCGT